MPAVRVELHPAAVAEARAAHAWYSERNQAAADAFMAEVDRAIALIAATLTAGQLTSSVLGGFCYAAFLSHSYFVTIEMPRSCSQSRMGAVVLHTGEAVCKGRDLCKFAPLAPTTVPID